LRRASGCIQGLRERERERQGERGRERVKVRLVSYKELPKASVSGVYLIEKVNCAKHQVVFRVSGTERTPETSPAGRVQTNLIGFVKASFPRVVDVVTASNPA